MEISFLGSRPRAQMGRWPRIRTALPIGKGRGKVKCEAGECVGVVAENFLTRCLFSSIDLGAGEERGVMG